MFGFQGTFSRLTDHLLMVQKMTLQSFRPPVRVYYFSANRRVEIMSYILFY
ncbi:hypothetical protein J6590_032516 [Homalodisca vitripennis]|nr:hypothetical protein J6590_032516 [Homalodisca vitripennis]